MNLEDIAEKAGVSRSTVSRVINNDRYVSASTRSRVLAVIEQERFEPNPAARALVTQRSSIIGVAIPQTVNVFFGDNSYYPMLLQGFGESINRHNYAMMLWMAESREPREDFGRRVVRFRQPDGLIITSVIEQDPLFERLVQDERLFVMVETPPAHHECVNFVTVDNVGAAADAVRFFIRSGRRRIATITGNMQIRDAQDRLRGYELALTEAGRPLSPELIVRGEFNREVGRNRMRALIPHKPDAVFAGGDTIAIGAMEALAEAGLRVPDDVAVIGFDDLDVAANAQLSTVRHDVQQVGATAAKLLIDLIEERLLPPQHIILPTELILRQTTDPVSPSRR